MQNKRNKRTEKASKYSKLFDEIKMKTEEQNKALRKLLKAINEENINKKNN